MHLSPFLHCHIAVAVLQFCAKPQLHGASLWTAGRVHVSISRKVRGKYLSMRRAGRFDRRRQNQFGRQLRIVHAGFLVAVSKYSWGNNCSPSNVQSGVFVSYFNISTGFLRSQARELQDCVLILLLTAFVLKFGLHKGQIYRPSCLAACLVPQRRQGHLAFKNKKVPL